MVAVNWTTIRPLDGSQRAGFEELCAQLARTETPVDAKFDRAGNPDAGVECYCTFPGGDEWGWQAKYFVGALEGPQWNQLDRSVRTALEKHPNLARYFVCIPRDRSDARIQGQQSAMETWDRHVRKWEGWAQARGMQVEFVWRGSSELLDRLSHRQHIGRLYYWFGQQGFDESWFSNRWEEARRVVGPRYTPEVHVELDIAKRLDLFARTDSAVDGLRSYAVGVWETLRMLRYPASPDAGGIQRYDLGALVTAGNRVLDEFATLEIGPAGDVQLGRIVDRIAEVQPLVEEAHREVAKLGEAYAAQQDPGGENVRYLVNPHVQVARDIARFRREMVRVSSQLESAERFINRQALVLTGAPGTGKTHLLCDFARRRLDAGAPTVLLMGQRFTDVSEPWNQARQHLGMHAVEIEEFVGAVEAAARVSNSRALVIIDALNEGRGLDCWPSHLSPFLARLESSPWIGVVISVRTTYQNDIIPQELRDRAASLTHVGFTGHEYEAVQTFFGYYGLEFPSTPLLHSEYRNPLYLKTVCEALSRSGATRVPRGIQGITAAFDLYWGVINRELAESLDYNPADNLVKLAVGAFAEELAKVGDGWLARGRAEQVVNQFLPGRPFGNSLYHGLVTSGVLVVDRGWSLDSNQEEVVFLAYERLADHVVAGALLQEYMRDRARPMVSRWLRSLSREVAGLGRRFMSRRGTGVASAGSDWSLLYGRGYTVPTGVLEALCIQAPEQTGRELVRIAPKYWDVWGIGDAILESIVWRRLDAFTDDTKEVLQEVAARGNSFIDPRDSLLTVSTIPGHPFNALYLDQRLRQDTMPVRDVWWSIYLDGTWGTEGPAARLIDWASGIVPDTSVETDVVDLAATCLAWMLTTSNRFLRDRATKALVALLTGRVESVQRLMERFADVDDAYVAERIYAVAYGVVMRSNDAAGAGRLAQRAYGLVFADGSPPAHVLLRDYARGVIERAVYLSPELEDDLNLDFIRPPYASTWPDVPDEDADQELERRMSEAAGDDEGNDNEWRNIQFSVTGWDFARYVIGTNFSEVSDDWLSLTLADDAWIPPAERKEDLIARFNHMERTAWEEFAETKPSMPIVRIFFDALVGLDDGPVTVDPPDNSELDDAYCRFVASMSSEHLCEWESLEEKRPGLELGIIQRYILGRVASLGWTGERFGEFDRMVRLRDRMGRESRKAERIGKKYQWIAYHEILAFIADRHQYRPRWGEPVYTGPGQLGRRDIDPSTVLSLNPRKEGWREAYRPCWWAPMEFDNWQLDAPIGQWVANDDDLPNLERGLVVSDPSDQDIWWINAYCFQGRHQPLSPDVRENDGERREIWYRNVAFLVPRGSSDQFTQWVLSGQYWEGDGQMGISDFDDAEGIFFGEYGWSPGFQRATDGQPLGTIEWCFPTGSDPASAHRVAASCSTSANGYDCSTDEDVGLSYYLPSYSIVRDCNLSWTGIAADHVDERTKIAAFDPSAHEPGPGALLLRSDILDRYLIEHELDLCWVIIGEKQTIGTTGQPYGWLKFQGAYVYRDGTAIGKTNDHFVPNPREP